MNKSGEIANTIHCHFNNLYRALSLKTRYCLVFNVGGAGYLELQSHIATTSSLWKEGWRRSEERTWKTERGEKEVVVN
jgi:hypothetical protein